MSEVHKYLAPQKFYPLYLEDDFFYVLDTADEVYALIPECQACGMVFAIHAQVKAHLDRCVGEATYKKAENCDMS